MAGAMAGSAILDYLVPSDGVTLATLTVNNNCNLACPHCYLQYAGKDEFVSDEIVDWILASHCRHLAIVGKEPLVTRASAAKSCRIVERAVAKGKRVSLITNGLGLEYLPESISGMIDFIDVSFDGGPATYQAYRGPSFGKLTDRISRSAERGYTRIRGLSVLSNATIGSLDDLLAVADLPGIELLMLSPYVPTKNDGHNLVSTPPLTDLLHTLSINAKFRKTQNVVLLLARHELDLLGWEEKQLSNYLKDPDLATKIRFVSHDPLELGVVRITYDGLALTPLQSLHPAEYGERAFRVAADMTTLDVTFERMRKESQTKCYHAN